MRALNSSENHPSAEEGWAQPSLEELPCLGRGADSWAGAWQKLALLGKSLPAAAHHPMALPDVPACPFTAHICPHYCGDGVPVGAATPLPPLSCWGSCKSRGCHCGRGQGQGDTPPTSSELLATAYRYLAHLAGWLPSPACRRAHSYRRISLAMQGHHGGFSTGAL